MAYDPVSRVLTLNPEDWSLLWSKWQEFAAEEWPAYLEGSPVRRVLDKAFDGYVELYAEQVTLIEKTGAVHRQFLKSLGTDQEAKQKFEEMCFEARTKETELLFHTLRTMHLLSTLCEDNPSKMIHGIIRRSISDFEEYITNPHKIFQPYVRREESPPEFRGADYENKSKALRVAAELHRKLGILLGDKDSVLKR